MWTAASLLTCMQLNRTKCDSLLFFTTAKNIKKNTTKGANWLEQQMPTNGPVPQQNDAIMCGITTPQHQGQLRVRPNQGQHLFGWLSPRKALMPMYFSALHHIWVVPGAVASHFHMQASAVRLKEFLQSQVRFRDIKWSSANHLSTNPQCNCSIFSTPFSQQNFSRVYFNRKPDLG